MYRLMSGWSIRRFKGRVSSQDKVEGCIITAGGRGVLVSAIIGFIFILHILYFIFYISLLPSFLPSSMPKICIGGGRRFVFFYC